jgi:Uma2 family endonuclease
MTTSTSSALTSNRPPEAAVPPLEPGDRLTRAEFERRYEAMPTQKKAELIEGVVYMPSSVRLDRHATPHADVVTWLGYYRAQTPGVRVGDNATTRLDLDNEPQPDTVLFIAPECGGQVRISPDDYLDSAPELVVEVASSSASYDLETKWNVYRRNGVLEYVVWRAMQPDLPRTVARHGCVVARRSGTSVGKGGQTWRVQ